MTKKKVQIVNNAADGIPEILLQGDIGLYDAFSIANEIGDINKSEDKKPVKLLRMGINSFGGSIQSALTIISAMDLFYKAGGEIETVNQGCADSSAGWIFSFGTRGRRKIMQFASMFFHPPLYSDGTTIKDLPEGDPRRVELEDAFEQLIDIFVASTGLARATIKNIMSGDTNMSADEAVQNGFADEKIQISNVPVFKENLSRRELVNVTSGLKYTVKEKVNNKPPASGVNLNVNKMKNLAKMLNLNPEASEKAIQDEITKVINSNSKLTADLKAANLKVTTAEGERDNYKTKLENLENKKIEEYVDAIIKNDATKKDSRESLINMAKGDFEAFKNIMPLQKKVVNGHVIDQDIEEDGKKGAENELNEAREFKNMNNQKREELKNSDYEKFTRLANSYDKRFSELLQK